MLPRRHRGHLVKADRDGVQGNLTMEDADGDAPEERIERAGDTGRLRSWSVLRDLEDFQFGCGEDVLFAEAGGDPPLLGEQLGLVGVVG